MTGITSYRVSSDGSLKVRLPNGREREATAAEWLELWSKDPRLTLKLVH